MAGRGASCLLWCLSNLPHCHGQRHDDQCHRVKAWRPRTVRTPIAATEAFGMEASGCGPKAEVGSNYIPFLPLAMSLGGVQTWMCAAC